MKPHDSGVVDEQCQKKCPPRIDDGYPPEHEHADDHDAAVQPQEGMLEDESEVDDEESEGAAAPGDSLAPPGVQCVGCVGIDVGKNVNGLVSQCVSDNPGLDVIALEEQ